MKPSFRIVLKARGSAAIGGDGPAVVGTVYALPNKSGAFPR